ncbi:MAG: glutathione S-transferase family protein [Pseudomonadota bacterium]
MALVLYEYPVTRSVRDRWILQELDVPFEAVVVDLHKGEHQQPAFLKLNPAARVPVLVDGDFVLAESAAIAVYLAEKFPDKGLVPADPRERARMLQWLFFTATELEQPLWRIAKHKGLYPRALRLPAEVELARADFAPMVAVTEAHMQERAYVAGDSVTVADFVLAYTLDWAKEAKMLEDCPALDAYIERMYSRPRAPLRIAAAKQAR